MTTASVKMIESPSAHGGIIAARPRGSGSHPLAPLAAAQTIAVSIPVMTGVL